MDPKSFFQKYPHSSRLFLIGPLALAAPEIPDDCPAVYVDGGTLWRGTRPGFSLGDNDSFEGPLDLTLPKEKDFSDFHFALEQIPQQFSMIEALGFLGGRKDHELLVLGETHHFLKTRHSPSTEIVFDRDILGYSQGQWTFQHQGVFSLIAFEPTVITLTGDCKYKLSEPKNLKAMTSFGLSNEASGVVRMTNSQPVFLFKTPPT